MHHIARVCDPTTIVSNPKTKLKAATRHHVQKLNQCQTCPGVHEELFFSSTIYLVLSSACACINLLVYAAPEDGNDCLHLLFVDGNLLSMLWIVIYFIFVSSWTGAPSAMLAHIKKEIVKNRHLTPVRLELNGHHSLPFLPNFIL